MSVLTIKHSEVMGACIAITFSDETFSIFSSAQILALGAARYPTDADAEELTKAMEEAAGC